MKGYQTTGNMVITNTNPAAVTSPKPKTRVDSQGMRTDDRNLGGRQLITD